MLYWILMIWFVIMPMVVHSKTTVTTKTDSDGWEHTTINDGKRTTRCTTHTDSSKVVHTTCEK